MAIRRVITSSCIALLISVTVALLCFYRLPHAKRVESGRWWIEGASKSNWPANPPAGWPSPEMCVFTRGFGAEESIFIVEVNHHQQNGYLHHMQQHAVHVGWPFYALSRVQIDSYIDNSRVPSNQSNSIAPSWNTPMTRSELLPYVPSLDGLLGNWLFYGIPSFIALTLIERINRLRRDKIGLCIKCKYPLEHLKTCPECGTPCS